MLRKALRLLVTIIATAAIAVAVVHVSFRQPPARVEQLRREAPRLTEFMRLRPVDEQQGALARSWTDLGSVSALAACAVVLAEDKNFFDHGGISWLQASVAAVRAATGSARGASTITQQLARNLFLAPDRTLRRKLAEAVAAKQLEHALSKTRILELYLNVVEWGPRTWGIADAARVYYGKRPASLDAFESAFLASQLQAPRQPLIGPNLDRSIWEQRRIIHRLYLNGAIDVVTWRRSLARVTAFAAAARGGAQLTRALTTSDDRPSADERRSSVPMAELLPAADKGVVAGIPYQVAYAPSEAVISADRLLAFRCGTDRSPIRVLH